jgi:hypothetical protein
MDINVNVNLIPSPELVSLLHSLCKGGNCDAPAEKTPVKTMTSSASKTETKKAEDKKEADKNTKALTKEDVRLALQPVKDANKLDEATVIMGEFGASKVSELKPEDYAAFIDRLKTIKVA